jgi:hopanoid biosynthesis associated protein HpnK
VTRRLIVNADDFGRSAGINAAIARAHQEGILTTASLMVNEPGAPEAVRLARDLPQLGVGLHLALTCGLSALGPGRVPGLADAHGAFRAGPVRAGLRYFARRGLRAQLRDEIAAQVERFHATGLPLDHLNGHLHLHLHPVVLDLLLEHATAWGLTRIRLTRDPFRLNTRLASGRWMYRTSHAAIFATLSRLAAPRLAAAGLRHTDQVFGLLQDGQVDESYLLRLLPALPPGDSELYSHPSPDTFAHELAALLSPRVRSLADQLGIVRIRYADL